MEILSRQRVYSCTASGAQVSCPKGGPAADERAKLLAPQSPGLSLRSVLPKGSGPRSPFCFEAITGILLLQRFNVRAFTDPKGLDQSLQGKNQLCPPAGEGVRSCSHNTPSDLKLPGQLNQPGELWVGVKHNDTLEASERVTVRG